MRLLELLQGSGAAKATWLEPAALLGVAVALWLLGRWAEHVLLRRHRPGWALATGVSARAVALIVALRTLPVLAGVDLPVVGTVDWSRALSALALAGVGTLVLLRGATWLEQLGEASGRAHGALVVGKAVRYGGAVLLALLVADSLGWDLTTLLATAGVVGVAVGFAAQASLSNMIAGVFLLVDRPFEVGDIVEITGLQGEVLEITLLSTRVRTLDNLVVRWPNEVVQKERITNFSQHPVRRLDVVIRVPVDVPLTALLPRLQQTARDTPPILISPDPEAHVRDLDGNGATVVVWAWVERNGAVAGRDALLPALYATMAQLGISARIPTYTYALAPSDAAPVKPGASGYVAQPEDV